MCSHTADAVIDKQTSYTVGSRQKCAQPFLALAWLLSLSACSNAYDTHLGSHTNDILSIGATEIIVNGFLQKFVFSWVLWPYKMISVANWQYIMGMLP